MLRFDVQAGPRLVQDEEVGLGENRLYQADFLGVALGQLPQLGALAADQREAVDQVVHNGQVGDATDPAHVPQVRPRAHPLRGGEPVWQVADQGTAFDRALAGPRDPGHDPEQRRLAGTV